MKRNVVPLMIVLVLLALVTLAPASPSLAAEIEQGLVEGPESDNDQELTAEFSYDIDGLTVTLTDSSSAGGCPIVLWTWEIGYPGPHFEPEGYVFDLDPDTDPNWDGEFDHTFELYGAYNISLTVTDECDATDTVTQRITVTKGRPRPW